MKKHIFLTLLFSMTCFVGIFGQSAKKSLNYQAVILDPKPIDIPGASLVGQPLSKGKVCLKFSLVNAQGSVDYEETQQTTTDEYGLVSLSIGTGTYSSGTYKSFESIVWDANVKSMKVAVSYDGCNTFKQVSTQALNYTPYALYAEAVDYKNVREAPTKLSQFSNDVGYILPKDLDPLKVDIKKNTEDIKANTAELKTNSLQIASANKAIIDNKKASDDAFLIVNQSISTLGSKVALNSDAIWVTEGKVADLQYQTSEIRKKINSSDSTINRKANIDSPVFTGTPELPSGTKAITQNSTDNSTKIATTAFVQQVAIDNQLLVKPFIDLKAPINSPVFTGTPELPSGTMAVTQDGGDKTNKIATTTFVQRKYSEAIDYTLQTFGEAKVLAQQASAVAQDATMQAQDAKNQAQQATMQAQDAKMVADQASMQSQDARMQADQARNQADQARMQADNASANANMAFNESQNARNQADNAINNANMAFNESQIARNQADNANNNANMAFGNAQDAKNQAQDALNYVNQNLVNEVTDEYFADKAQTDNNNTGPYIFFLSSFPSQRSRVKMYINGIRISNRNYFWMQNQLIFSLVPINNQNQINNNSLPPLNPTDRIQFDYYTNDNNIQQGPFPF